MSLFLVRFRELVSESGKMQKEICKDLGISKQKISNWNTGYTEPNIDDILLIANYFDVTTDYLLGLENEDGTKVKIHNNFSNSNNSFNNSFNTNFGKGNITNTGSPAGTGDEKPKSKKQTNVEKKAKEIKSKSKEITRQLDELIKYIDDEE